MQKLTPVLYIEGERVDLFPDESIYYRLDIKDVKEFEKTRGEWTRPFTVPASKANNKIFEHYYNANVNISFNPNVSRSATIEINKIPYKTGLVKLERVEVENGRPKHYQIVFYSNIIGLKETLGDTRLYELSSSVVLERQDRLKNLYQMFDSTAVIGGLGDNAIATPLVSTTRFITYSGSFSDDAFILNEALITNEVRPAVNVRYLLNLIEQEFGIDIIFNGVDDFLSSPSTDPNGKLYLWLNRFAGRLTDIRQEWNKMETASVVIDVSGVWDSVNDYFNVSSTTGNPINTYTVAISTTAHPAQIELEDIEYEIMVYDAVADEIIAKASGSGEGNYEFQIARPSSGEPNQNLEFYVRTGHPFQNDGDSGVVMNSPGFASIRLNNFIGARKSAQSRIRLTDTTYTTKGETYTEYGQLPNITCFDFLVGLAKMFNCVLVPADNNVYRFRTIDNFYNSGSEVNITEYVDQLNFSARSIDFYGEIKFLFEPNETVLAKNFYDTVGGGEIGYGDLRTTILDSSGNILSRDVYEVQLPFTNLLFERAVANSGIRTDYCITSAVDIDQKPVKLDPVLFQYTDLITASTDYKCTPYYDEFSDTTVDTFHLMYQWDVSDTVAAGKSMNFGNEKNPYTGLIDNWDGVVSSDDTDTLYATYYQDFITDLYDQQARQYNFKGVLPLGVVIDLTTADTVIIGSTKYRINNIEVNLTTGEAGLDLRNLIE